jgi:hypothetical protein
MLLLPTCATILYQKLWSLSIGKVRHVSQGAAGTWTLGRWIGAGTWLWFVKGDL